MKLNLTTSTSNSNSKKIPEPFRKHFWHKEDLAKSKPFLLKQAIRKQHDIVRFHSLVAASGFPNLKA
jgi:hypothetical protein